MQTLIDTKGKVIDQRAKDNKSAEIDGTSKFCGHRFLLKTRLYGDKKCIYCGRWFHWKDTEVLDWLRENNIDRMNIDGVTEPLHCGSEHCRDYHFEVLKWEKINATREVEGLEKRSMELFKQLQSRGVIV